MHDCQGNPIKEGDVVLVPFKVHHASANDEYCNATLVTLAPMHPTQNGTVVTLNTRQTIRANDNDDAPYVMYAGGPQIDSEALRQIFKVTA